MPIKKKKGESKQSYLRRCVAAQRAAGASDVKAMSTCAGNWKAEMADADNDATRLTGGPITVQLAEGDAGTDAAARFAILAYTGKIVDWGWWRFIIDLKGIEAKPAFPALREHARDRVVGTCTEWKVDANGMHVLGDFSRATPDAAEVLALCQEGFPMQASVGIRGLAIDYVEKGQTRKVNGITVDGPCEIWTKSVVQEVSFVSLGADDDTAAIVMHGEADNHLTEDKMDKMDKLLREKLERMGLEQDASEEVALAFLHGVLFGETIENPNGDLTGAGGLPKIRINGDVRDEAEMSALAAKIDSIVGKRNNTVTLGAPGQSSQKDSPADVTAAVQAALAADRKRTADISNMCARLGLPTSLAQELANSGASIEAARARALDELAKANPAAGSFNMGADESDKFRSLAAEGISMRSGQRVEKPQDGSREFRGMSLTDFSRLCLERGGFSTRGLSASQVADKILSRGDVALSASVSDFKSIFMDVANRRMLDGYTETPQTWRPLVSVVTASDFKDVYGIALSEAPDFQLVGEHGEYKTGELKDKQESYRIAKYGRILTLTREMIVNDDLRAFARIPQMLGVAAARKASDIVWGLLLANPVMKDGKTLFHAARGNIEATVAVKTPVSGDALSSARKAMRKFKGLNGARIDVQPTFLVIPVEQETQAEVLLRSIALPTANMSAGVHNPWAGKLTPIAEPRLDDVSTKAWYLFASPSQVDTIEVAYLDGNEAPTITEHEEFRTDALAYKARLEMGAGVMDSVGVFRNPGE